MRSGSSHASTAARCPPAENPVAIHARGVDARLRAQLVEERAHERHLVDLGAVRVPPGHPGDLVVEPHEEALGPNDHEPLSIRERVQAVRRLLDRRVSAEAVERQHHRQRVGPGGRGR